jgi:UDP-N-acetylmuramoyl-tripeptide--D-alanyl-D-alanine ligase
MNSLAMLACVHAMGADLAMAALALGHLEAPKGRGERHVVDAPGRSFTLVDESYNANPASMRAAIEALGQTHPKDGGRRIAVLGDMLELGPESMALHRELASVLAREDIDLVFACGPHMRELFKALPQERQGAYAENSAELLDALLECIQQGDAVMVKGSFGSRMGMLVDALRALDNDDAENIRRNRGEA